MRQIFLSLLLGVVLFGCTSPTTNDDLAMTAQQSSTSARLIGLDPVNERVVWASGTGGTYVRTTDGGATWTTGTVPGGDSWTSASPPPLPGIFGGAYVPGLDPAPLVVVGPAGIAYSWDDGERWTTASNQSHWSVAFVGPQAGWAVGPDGRISELAVE